MILNYQEYISNNNNYSERIPIFRTGNQSISDLHEDIKNLYYETINNNPTYLIVYFQPHERKEFISSYYPQYLNTYNQLIPGAYQADLFRLLVVHKHGGIYCDFSMKFLVSINEIVDLQKYKLITVIEPYYWGLFNGFFAAQPNTEFLLNIADRIVDNVKNKYYGRYDLEPTGPMCWGKVMNKLFGRNETSSYYGFSHPDIKFYKLSIHYLLTAKQNAYIHEIGSEKFLIQHKLSYFKNYGLYSSKSNTITYHTLWRQGKIYKNID